MVDPGKLVPKNRSVMGFNLIWLTERHEMLVAELDAMCGRVRAAGAPRHRREFPWVKLPAALSYLRSGAHRQGRRHRRPAGGRGGVSLLLPLV